MAKGALYWRLKDEKTGKWTYKKVQTYEEKEVFGRKCSIVQLQEEE